MSDTRFTIRMDDELRSKMKRMDINWSEYLRTAIRERIGEDKRRTIQNLVDGYIGEREKLWTLHIFSYGTSKRRVYETAELILKAESIDDIDKVVDDVYNDLEQEGLTSMYDRIEAEDIRVGEAIRNEIIERGSEPFEEVVIQRLTESSEKIKTGVWILALFLWNDLEDDRVSIIPDGLERTWGIAVDGEVDIDDLVEVGLLYRDHYSSNAYSHADYWVPDYTRRILEELREDAEMVSDIDMPTLSADREEVKATLERDDAQKFINWMHGRTKRVTRYNEDEEIKEGLEDLDDEISKEEFNELRQEFVKKGILIIDLSPHRSSTGSRSSRPAKWIYRFTDPALSAPMGVLL